MYPNSMSDQSDSGGRSPYGGAYGQRGFNPQPNAPKPYPVQPGSNYGYIGHSLPQPMQEEYGDQQQQASIEKIRALEAQSRRSGPIQQTDAPPRLY